MAVPISTNILLLMMSSLVSLVVCRLPLIKQHATTTIQMTQGQVYNCVPFQDQLAFRRPSSNSDAIPNISETQGRHKGSNGFGLEGNGCPTGTVPILYRPSTSNESQTPNQAQRQCRAVLQGKANGAKKFFGAEAWVNLHKPSVQGREWSSARVKLSNVGDSIEAGWMVNPQIFNDNEAHLYVKFAAGGVGCINTQCAGFVEVDKRIPLGFIPANYSDVGGRNQYTWYIGLNKHQDDGNWWMSMFTEATGRIPLGYWPKSLFSPMSDFASLVEFGGEVYTPGSISPPPSMGNGKKAQTDYTQSAYIRNITVVNENSVYVVPDDRELIADCGEYSVKDAYVGAKKWGHVVYYGGPN